MARVGTKITHTGPWLTRRETYPLLICVGVGVAWVGWNIGRHMLLNPEVQVSRSLRGKEAWLKQAGNHLGEDWYRAYQAKFRHHDMPVSEISLWEPWRAGYWTKRAQVARDPARYTASGVSATQAAAKAQ
jgi:hypothetical protein